MYFSIQSKTLELTQALRDFIEKHTSKLARQSQRIQAVTVFVENVSKKKNDVQSAIARIKISLPGKDIVVERRARDLYEAIVDVTRHANRYVHETKARRLSTKRQLRFMS